MIASKQMKWAAATAMALALVPAVGMARPHKTVQPAVAMSATKTAPTPLAAKAKPVVAKHKVVHAKKKVVVHKKVVHKKAHAAHKATKKVVHKHA